MPESALDAPAEHRSRRLSPAARRLIAAATDRILPADDWPGARDVGVPAYVEWVVEQPCFEAVFDDFSRGCDLLDSVATVRFARCFAECGSEQQDEVLRQLASVPHGAVHRFVTMLVRMALAGYFCDPKYGGNEDGRAWARIGFTPDPGPRPL